MAQNNEAQPLCTASALFVDDEGGVLIVDPTYSGKWSIPGGRVFRGETPRESYARRLEHDFGLELEPGRLLVVDWAPKVHDGRVVFVFDGGELTDEQLDKIELNPDEISAWAFLPPEELFVMTEPRVNRRVTAALDAKASGTTVYLEHGVPAGPA